jgi:hypothetical protein
VVVLDLGAATRDRDGSTYINPFYNAEDVGSPNVNADLYSVGALLIQMITGQSSLDALPGIPQPLRGVIAKAVASDFRTRYPSAQAFLDALRPFANTP